MVPLRLALFLICYLQWHHLPIAVGSKVSISNNGYDDVVVAISPDVPEAQAPTLILNIQKMLKQASSALYTATKKRAFIRSVRILVPKTWTAIAANSCTWETFKDADVRIDVPNCRYGNQPFTVQPGLCGEPGDYIHLTPDYIMNINTNQYGPPGKLFVREWARLRYGVFDENGYTGSNAAYPMFYKPKQQTTGEPFVPNVCSNKASSGQFAIDYGCSVDPSTGLYNSLCTYSWKSSFNPKSSIMSDYRMLSSADLFCDDTTHNTEAPNKQNALCNYRSVWSVISNHQDFIGNNNNPRPGIADTTPSFNVVRCDAARYVFVADVSGSMATCNRIGRMYDSARRWIKYDVPDGTKLGIVKFSDTATLLTSLTAVTTSSRPTLMNLVPSRLEGGTCIGCGLNTAVAALSPVKGGVILLMTDGEENVSPLIKDALPNLINSGARVVSIAFGTSADKKIEELATKTNGLSFFVNDCNAKNEELNDVFTGSLAFQPAVPSKDLKALIFDQKYQNSGQVIQGPTTVDFTIGNELTFRVDYSLKSHVTYFAVTSPSGITYSNVVYDDSSKLMKIEIPGIAQVGVWKFTLFVSTSTSEYINLIVTSKPKSDTAPITVDCFDPKLVPRRFVGRVMQGGNPIIGASVKAYLERPDAKTEIIDLFDNGAGADSTKNDGIYTQYYPNAPVTGRYTLKCVVTDTPATVIDDCTNRLQPFLSTPNAIRFNRIQSGGSFLVDNVTKPGLDVYPPSQVRDLKVVSINVNQMTLTIEWTATGDDLDKGTVSSYEIKYSPIFGNLMDNKFATSATAFGPQDVVSGSMQPLEAGKKQRVSFRMPLASKSTTYFVALRAKDKVNQLSSVSNIVSVQIAIVNNPVTLPPTIGPSTTPRSTPTTAPVVTSTSTNKGCNDILTTSSGLLTSPNFPGAYANNYNCQWIIRVTAGSKVRLTFTDFATEGFYDYVEVYDGSAINAGRLLLKHSGSALPPPLLISTSNEMLVRFVTDATGNFFRGWRATYVKF